MKQFIEVKFVPSVNFVVIGQSIKGLSANDFIFLFLSNSELYVTDIRDGVVYRHICYSASSSAASLMVTVKNYAHRTIPSLLVQDITAKNLLVSLCMYDYYV